ncbi:hypothetical protein AMTR_s00026p00151330, partial [Amborella trichopoda]
CFGYPLTGLVEHPHESLGGGHHLGQIFLVKLVEYTEAGLDPWTKFDSFTWPINISISSSVVKFALLRLKRLKPTDFRPRPKRSEVWCCHFNKIQDASGRFGHIWV